LSSLVARFAANSFWLARYLERAENLARILHINETYARDKPEGPDWRRMLDLYADSERFFGTHAEANAHSVLQFYILDRYNPTSIVSALINARQNARSIRHLISTEMWTHLNIFYSQLLKMTARDIQFSNLANTANAIILSCQTFEGIAEGTLMRGEPWCFYQLGKYIERADQTTRILDIGYNLLPIGDGNAVTSVQWNVLLRSVCGYHAYRSRYPCHSGEKDIQQFLLYDPEFPRALELCTRRITVQLRDMERRHGAQRHSEVERARRTLEFALETGPGNDITPEKMHTFLDRIQILLGDVTDAVKRTYFVHPPADNMYLGNTGQNQ
jgi:uncharacterized alpha-E superfamily protein